MTTHHSTRAPRIGARPLQRDDRAELLAWDIVADGHYGRRIFLYRTRDDSFNVRRETMRPQFVATTETLSRAEALALFETLRVQMLSRDDAFPSGIGSRRHVD
jgi:hypothetical protein